jgi:hypothetical protein
MRGETWGVRTVVRGLTRFSSIDAEEWRDLPARVRRSSRAVQWVAAR